MMMKYTIPSLEQLPEVARDFLTALPPDTNVIALYGAMGAGKTTFVKALCDALGVTDEVNSPTFSIVNEYLDRDENSIFHFDFYRIETEAEAFDLGLDDYFYSGRLCLLEWPEQIEGLLPPETLRLSITEQPDGSRKLETV